MFSAFLGLNNNGRIQVDDMKCQIWKEYYTWGEAKCLAVLLLMNRKQNNECHQERVFDRLVFQFST